MTQFIQRDPSASRADALRDARLFLRSAIPGQDQNAQMYLQAAGIFLLFKDDNDLSMAGPEEIAQLAEQLEDLAVKHCIFEELLSGFFLPAVDDKGEICFYPVPDHEWDETGVPKDLQEEYRELKAQFNLT